MAFAALPEGGIKMPVAFIPNLGQSGSDVLFHLEGSSESIALMPDAIIVGIQQEDDFHVLRITPLGLNPAAQIVGLAPTSGKTHFLKGQPEDWVTDLPRYEKVAYLNAWPGMDLICRVHDGRMEYDIEAASGADPQQVRFAVTGADELRLTEDGALCILVDGREIVVQHPPVTFQGQGESRRQVASRFVLDKERMEFGFALPERDLDLVATVDPLLVSYTLGGSTRDYFKGMAFDSSGNILITGSSASSDFPVNWNTHNGDYDIILLKLSPDGTQLLTSTYLGGDGNDGATAIAVDDSDNIYLAGYSTGGTFSPFSYAQAYDADNNGDNDIVVLKINIPPLSAPTIVAATYLGGDGTDLCNDIDIDSEKIVVAGYTKSPETSVPFPLVNAHQSTRSGTQDAVLASLSLDLSTLNFSTLLGGADVTYSTKGDEADGVAISSSGEIYMAGRAYSGGFSYGEAGTPSQTLQGESDAFVSRFSGTGVMQYCALIGGDGIDFCRALALDSSDNVILTGTTYSTDFPTSSGAFDESKNSSIDVYVYKCSIAYNGTLGGYLSTMGFSTLLGGSGADWGLAAAVGQDDTIYVGGLTYSADWPRRKALRGSGNTNNGVEGDAFVSQFSADGSSLLWSTFYGGARYDVTMDIDFLTSGELCIIGNTKDSTDFPVVNAPALAGGDDDNEAEDGFFAILTPADSVLPPYSILLNE